MHRCLQIDEILRTILTVVSEEDRRSVASVSLTCRDFKEAALDVLWQTQSSLAPFVKCMPSDLWKITPTPFGSDEKFHISLNRPLTQSDWSRFSYHAPRVHVLNLIRDNDSVNHWADHEVVYKALDSCPDIFPLFPNLRVLTTTYHISQYNCPHLSRRIIGPRMSSLSCHCLIPAFYQAIISQALHLNELRISGPFDSSFASDFIELLCVMESLETVVFREASLSVEIAHHLSSLPNLRYLAFGDLSPDIYFSNTPQSFAFAALRSLELNRLKSLASSIPLISQLKRLETLKLTSWQYPTALDMDDLFTVLLNGNHPNLHSLEVLPLCDLPEVYDAYVIPSSSLRRILCFANMTTLTLDIHSFDLDDKFITDLALAWPNLQSLWLGSLRYHSHKCGTVTLVGLFALISSCPDLAFLGMTLDFSLNNLATVGKRMPQNTKIHVLCVGQSPCDDVPQIATLLREMFPKLNFIHSSHERAAWDQVQSLLQQ